MLFFYMQPEADMLKAERDYKTLGTNVPSDNMELGRTKIILFYLVGWTQYPALSAE